MESSGIRQKLHQYIDKGDDKLLKLLHDWNVQVSRFESRDETIYPTGAQ